MLKYEKAYLLYVRSQGQKIKSSLTQTELDYALQVIHPEEIQIISKWKEFINYLKKFPYYSSLDDKDVILKLKDHTQHQFPLPLSFVPKKTRNEIVIGYYLMLGWDLSSVSFTVSNNNNTQNQLITSSNNNSSSINYPQLSLASLKKYELAYILTEYRQEKIDSKAKVTDMRTKIGTLSQDENISLNKFRSLVKETFDYYPEYSVTSLITHLGINNKHAFPMPSSFLPKKNEIALAYYRLKGFDVQKMNKTFTEEQNYILHPAIEGMHIINAGPGTGKTTVANERAYRLRNEGVLLISYTNDAINENYNRLKTFPNMRGTLKKKEYTKDRDVINVTTVDSLAIHIVSASKVGSNFDMNIVNATNLCPRIAHNRTVKKYRHIIVDEAQDIDDSRGKLILSYFLLSGAKTLCIFGDPRQRIHENHGNWYSKLWVEGSYLGRKCTKIGFSYSYRFHNKLHLDLSNHLSSQRPHIHHELILSEGIPVDKEERIHLYNSQYQILDVDLGKIADYIKDELHIKNKVSFSEIAIVGASMNKDNATSAMAGKICSVFKDRGIPCYTKSDGSFIPNAVLFSTIHSIKGKEFDYVFIFGSDSFPETFKNIPYESAESMIYVMHTRARKRMYYISVKREKYTPVRGLRLKSNPYINNVKFIDNKPFAVKEFDQKIFKISELSKEFSFLKLIETNEFSLNMMDMDSIKIKDNEDNVIEFEGNILPDKPEEVNARFWGIFCALGVQLYLVNKFHDVFYKCIDNQIMVLSDNMYNNRNRNGQIVNGIDLKTGKIVLRDGMVNKIRDEEMTQLKLILGKKVEDLVLSEIVFLAKIYDYIVSGNTQSRYDIETQKIIELSNSVLEVMEISLLTLFKKIAGEIEKEYGQCIKVEKMEYSKYMNICGSIDAFHDMYTLEFKTSNRDLEYTEALQVYLYSLCNETEPILINLQTGKVKYVTSDRGLEQWKHIVKSYSVLRTHVDLVTDRVNKQIEKRKAINPSDKGERNRFIDKTMFVLDTEFASGFRGSTYIFDIAVINLFDPYRSLILPINPGPKYIKAAVDWLNEPSLLFENTIDIFEFKKKFMRLTEVLGIKKIKLMYYVCKTDVQWCDSSLNLEKEFVDLSGVIKQDAKRMGYINSGSAPPLSDYYDVKCNPTEYQDHLKLHTSLADSLLLYEMLHLDYI